MNVQKLKDENRIIFETISGSHSYGTNVATSDVDLRGIFVLPKRDHLSLISLPQEVGDEKQDVKYYELRKFFDLAKDCNPNIIELLFMPKDCVKIQTPVMDKLLANRSLFVSAKAYHTFAGYAHAQIGKAKGKNKFVNNPKPAMRPTKEDFCFIIDPTCEYEQPCRPIPLAEMNIPDLEEFHCARLEHTSNIYRLYHYGKDSKGVFRGQEMLVPESIPLEDEAAKFQFLMIFEKDLYERELSEWNSYWDWMKNRNEARWVDQEKGKLNYDQKNMLHCYRLLLSGKNILTKGEPIVKFEGEQLQYLRDIRAGKFAYDDIMAQVENMMKELDGLKATTTLPHSADIKKIDALYLEIMEEIG